MKYQFNITVEGSGKSPDEAFANALEKLSSDDPSSAVINEVVYTKIIEETKVDSGFN